jgi:hypothetical protein
MNDVYIKDDWKIKIGDLVIVNFNSSKYTLTNEAEVLSIPCATGDSWILRDTKTGITHYISEGCTITLLKKKNEAQ